LLSGGCHYYRETKDLANGGMSDHRIPIEGGIKIPGETVQTLLHVEDQEHLHC
jgi:hypothetical protein